MKKSALMRSQTEGGCSVTQVKGWAGFAKCFSPYGWWQNCGLDIWLWSSLQGLCLCWLPVSPFRWLRAAGRFAIDFSCPVPCSALHCTGFPWLSLAESWVPAWVETAIIPDICCPLPQAVSLQWLEIGSAVWAGALLTLLVQDLSALECTSSLQL